MFRTQIANRLSDISLYSMMVNIKQDTHSSQRSLIVA